MTVFSDNFNRANGALGGNWTAIAGTLSITSNAVSATGTGSSFNTTISDLHYQEASANVTWNNTTFVGPGVLVCVAADGTGGFATKLRVVSSNPTLSVTTGGYGGTTYILDYTLPSPLPPYFNVKLIWADGNLELFYNGASVGTVSSALYIGAPYMGIGCYASYGSVLDFLAVATDAVSLSADPSTVGNYGECTDITLTGVNTNWTAGTPGSPTFTVNHGTISAQTVASTTSATITYCPGDYLGSVIITDPSTGQTVGIVVTSDPNTVPPTGMWLSQEAVDYIERSAVAQTNPTILNQETVIDPNGVFGTAQDTLGWFYRNLAKLIDPDGEPPTGDHYILLLWNILNGGNGYVVGESIYDELLVTRNTAINVETFFETGVPDTWWTVVDLIATLKGTSTRDLTDVYDEISSVASTTGASILNAIADLRGDEVATVAAVLSAIATIRTGSNWTLGDVKNWAEAVQGTTLPTVKDVVDKLGLIQPSTSYSLTTLTTAISDLHTDVAAVKAVVDAIKTTVDGLPTEITIPNMPPVWPGVANVTLGSPSALVDGLTLTGPMHGIIVNITGNPAGAGKYLFGAEVSWTHVGAVAFVNDRGDFERPDSLGLEDHVITPRTMAEAASCVIRLNSGFSGTARTWITT